MKKISFSERYGMQQSVLDGTKTMTRRIVPDGTLRIAKMEVDIHGGDLADRIKDHSLYLWHDEIAIAQAYNTLRWPSVPGIDWNAIVDEVTHAKGWKNKMFVKAKYMPHRIRIIDIRVERLQDISDEDCLCEGIYEDAEEHGGFYTTPFYDFVGNKKDGFDSPREAFAALIDCISGRGTWQRNPCVFAYEFELIK